MANWHPSRSEAAASIRPSVTEIPQWRRRGPVTSPRQGLFGTDPIVVAAVPPRGIHWRSQRASYQMFRRRKLSPEQEAAIRAEAGTRSLREITADLGVSPETVRAVVREPDAAGVT